LQYLVKLLFYYYFPHCGSKIYTTITFDMHYSGTSLIRSSKFRAPRSTRQVL